MKKIIIIGGGAAGAKAASKAKRLNSKNYVELYTNENHIATSLCGLPYYIEGSVSDINKLIIKTPEDFINMGIEVFLEHTLEEIYPEKNCVLINGNHIFYDELILALGARSNLPNIENIDANNIFTLRTLDDGIKIKEAVTKFKKAIIIGGGYIGIELSEALTKNSVHVSLVEEHSRLLPNGFDEDFSKILQKIVYEKCPETMELFLNERVEKIYKNEDNDFTGIKTLSGKEIYADFCVFCTGTKPNVEIAKNAGIMLGITGGIHVDTKMRTNYSNIYAAGDCSEEYCIVTRQPIYLGLGTFANKEGRVAAINAVSEGDKETYSGVLRSAITRFYDYSISKTGLTFDEAKECMEKINIEPVEAIITKKDKASYMPNASDLTIKIVADKRSGEILGAQGIGKLGYVAQRINTIATVLKTRATVEDVLHLDLPYSPPFSSSIDPILTACYKLKELMKK